MDDVVRGGALLLSVRLGLGTLVVLACGCAASDPAGPIGVGGAHVGTNASAAGSSQPPLPGAWSAGIPPGFRESFVKVNRARFVSKGHLVDRFAVDVYANAAGKEALDGKSDAAAAGAIVVKEHFDRTVVGERPGPIYAMEKREKGYDPEHGDWRYVVLGPRGETLAEGKGERCVGCHDEARRDHLFAVTE